MWCPFCKKSETKVVDSRLIGDGDQVRRRRECLICSSRFTTYENIELTYPRILKRDNRWETFKPEKLKAGILRALEKRFVPSDLIDNAINRLMKRLRGYGESECSSQTLGEWVMEELKSLDEVAYIRFASVYKRFKSIEDFEKELSLLKQDILNLQVEE